MRLLLPFLLVAITSVSHAQRTSWVMQETRQINRWTIESNHSDLIYASVNGMISNEDRLRLAFQPSDKCKNTALFTSFHTNTQAEDITTLEGLEIAIEVPNGELPVTISDVRSFGNNNYVAVVGFVYMGTADMRQMMSNMNSGLDELEVTIKPTETFNAEKYFNAPTNRWSLAGSMEAFDRAKQLCERIVEDTII